MKTANEIWIDLINAMKSFQSKITVFSIRSEIGKLFRAISLEFEEIYSAIYKTRKARSIRYATQSDLDDLLLDYELTRKEATFAVGEIVLYGTKDTTIPAGFIVQKNNTNFRYSTDSSVTIGTSGYATVLITALDSGEQYQAEINTIQQIISSPPDGLNRITNLTRTTGGSNVETDEEFRKRGRDFFETSKGGNAIFIENQARKINGIRYAKYINNYPMIGENSLIVSDYTGNLTNSLKSQIESSITEYFSGNRKNNINFANRMNLFIISDAIIESGSSINDIQKQYEQKVKTFSLSNFDIGATIYNNSFKLDQDILGLKAITSVLLKTATDPYKIPGISIIGFEYSGSFTEQILNIYYYAGNKTINFGETGNQYLINQNQILTVTLKTSLISSITLSIDTNKLPETDQIESIRFTLTSRGIKLTDYQIPIIQSVTLIEDSDVN